MNENQLKNQTVYCFSQKEQTLKKSSQNISQILKKMQPIKNNASSSNVKKYEDSNFI